MDSYLSKVKRTEEKVKKPVVVEEKMKKEDAEEFKAEEESYMAGRKSVIQKFMDFIAGTEEDEEEKKPEQGKIEEGEDEKELDRYDKKNKSFLGSVKGFFGREEKEEKKEQNPEELKSNLPEDIKEALRIQNRWLMLLPDRTIREFKESEDYRVYKATLQKYGLIKVK